MYSPTTRLLTVLELLQSKGAVTGPELAARLEVDVRSVRRYITMLRDMGIPVDSEPGRYGKYQLRPGFRLPPLMFNNTEILAVILGLMAARRMGMTAASHIESATAKIERVLPNELRERVRAVQSMLTLDIPGQRSTMDGFVEQFSDAAYQCRQLWMEYQTRSTTERVIDVYGLVYHTGHWYAVGYCHLRQNLRVFRLDRVQQTKLLEISFEPPENFDVLDHLLHSLATIPSTWTIELVLKTTLETARARISSDIGVLEEVEHGVLLSSWADDLNWMARYLVWIGLPFEIIRPVELHDALRQLAEHIVQMTDSAKGG